MRFAIWFIRATTIWKAMIVLLMKPMNCTMYFNNCFTLLSYVVISFKLISITLLNYNCTYTQVIYSTHIHGTTHVSVFCTNKNRMVKITCSSSEMVLWTIKYTMIYSGSGPSLKIIALRPVVWYWRWTRLQWGEQSTWEVCVVKEKMDLVPAAWRVGVPFIDRAAVE
jgi:hypothetical protein